jgi:hypothetical protein
MTIKSDGITADAKGRHSNIETVLSQVRMALRKKTWDARPRLPWQ